MGKQAPPRLHRFAEQPLVFAVRFNHHQCFADAANGRRSSIKHVSSVSHRPWDYPASPTHATNALFSGGPGSNESCRNLQFMVVSPTLHSTCRLCLIVFSAGRMPLFNKLLLWPLQVKQGLGVQHSKVQMYLGTLQGQWRD